MIGVMPTVFEPPPAAPADAAAFFAVNLSCQTDVSDVHSSLAAAAPGLVLTDSRSAQAWRQGHLPGAIHLPTAEIAARAAAVIPAGVMVVTYCWGPGCNGATRAALEYARLGYRVKEMIGGYEYWVREGFPVLTDAGETQCRPDDLTTLRRPRTSG
jgi:rhodanese-related sulfurtransferase